MGHLLATTYYTSNSTGTAAALFVFFLIIVIFYVVTALGAYGTYKKAGAYGEPAWSAFVPVYNYIVLLRIAGRPKNWAWFLLLLLLSPIPIVGFLGSIAFLVINIFVLNDLSKSFGHDAAFTVGLVLIPVVFFYILWLGQSQYRGPAGPDGLARAGGGYPPAGTGYPPAQPGYPPAGRPTPGGQPGYPPAGQPTPGRPARLPAGRPTCLPPGRNRLPSAGPARLPAGRSGPPTADARLPAGRSGSPAADAADRTASGPSSPAPAVAHAARPSPRAERHHRFSRMSRCRPDRRGLRPAPPGCSGPASGPTPGRVPWPPVHRAPGTD